MRCNNCIHYDVCYQYDIIGEDDSEMCALYERERPHGEWKMDSEYGFIFHCSCSECNSDVMKYISGSENWWLNSTPNFCPRCGSDNRPREEA